MAGALVSVFESNVLDDNYFIQVGQSGLPITVSMGDEVNIITIPVVSAKYYKAMFVANAVTSGTLSVYVSW
jgi:hypothetical protein